MFTHPGSIPNTVTNLDNKCIQMNAVDIRVAKFSVIDYYDMLYSEHSNQIFEISEDETKHKYKASIEPELDSNGKKFWVLPKGAYEFDSIHYVTVPKGYCGYLVTRSSLNRNGILIHSGVFDAGFRGFIGGTLYNFGGMIKVYENTRICQFLMGQAETVKMYDGQYQDKNEKGSTSSSPVSHVIPY